MDTLFFATVFALLCAALLLLPFAPAWLEWRFPTDSAALAVPKDDGQDPLFLARCFRERMARSRPDGPHAGYQPVDEFDLLDPDTDAELRGLPVLACQPIHTVGAVTCLRPFYSTADLDFRGGAMFSEVMTEGRLDLGPRTRVLGWAHADGAVRLGEYSVATQRVTSAEVVCLARGCCFEHVHAPVVLFGREAAVIRRPHTHVDASEATLAILPGAEPRGAGMWRIDGDCELPAGRYFRGSLVVSGVLSIGAGAYLDGSVKAHKGVLVGADVCVTGAVVCEGGIQVLQRADIGGPVVGESHMVLASGARLGRPGAPTTVSADAIIAEEGALVHGSVWARQAGVVWGGAA